MEPPSKAEILRQIQAMMKELFELEADRVQPEARLIEDLELDSLDDIIVAIQQIISTQDPATLKAPVAPATTDS